MADFFAVRKNHIELAGTIFDSNSMLAILGLCGSADYIVANECIVAADGILTGIKEEEPASNVDKESKRII